MEIKRDDYVSNEQILNFYCQKSRLRWLGHVERMQNVAAKMILFGELEHGSRSIGRPKLRYKDNCKQLLKRIDLLDWTDVAMDRPLWRSKIQAVCKSLFYDIGKISKEERKKKKMAKISIFNIYLDSYSCIITILCSFSFTSCFIMT